MIIALYVDDTLLAGTPKAVTRFKKLIKQRFKITDLGEIRKHLGIWYSRGKDANGSYIKMEMTKFRDEMVNDFEMYTEKGRYPWIS